MEIKLKLKIKDVEIELSEQDAVELRKALERLFGEKEYIPYPYYPYPYYSIPTPTWPSPIWTSSDSKIEIGYTVTA